MTRSQLGNLASVGTQNRFWCARHAGLAEEEFNTPEACKNVCTLEPACGAAEFNTVNGQCCIFPEGVWGNEFHTNAACYRKLGPAPNPTPAPTQYVVHRRRTAQAGGDPHLTNVKGERFNIKKAGSVPLLKIPAGGKQLKIMGLIEQAKQCSKVTFITELSLTGSWLEKKVDVAVNPNRTDGSTFFLAVDGQRIWTHSNDVEAPRFDYSGKQVGGSESKIFEPENGHFFIDQLAQHETAESKPGVKFQLANAPGLSITVTYPMVKASVRPHLNLDVKGLESHAIVSVGGLLGSDDHSEYSMTSAECKSFARHSPAEEVMGSTAEASW